MNINMKGSAVAAFLLFTACTSHAANVESEVSDTDTVVIGAASEKITLRVTGLKNLLGTESRYGYVTASTTSVMGKLALTFSPEHKPLSWGGNGYVGLQGNIVNQNGDEYSILLFGGGGVPKLINGTTWLITSGNMFYGELQKLQGTLVPGVYPVTIRAAIYQE